MTDGLHVTIGHRPSAGDIEQTQVEIDLGQLIGSHACFFANSGGGKSGALRKLFEATHGHIQHIILDVEDEFYTLREKFDYVIAGGDGADVPAKLGNARQLARMALEQGFSLIVQMNDLGDDAPAFVATFVDAIMNAPKAQWRPLLIALDEAQRFAPTKGETEASAAVRDIVQRGRKRGFTGIFATLRISDLDPALRGQINNWLLGRTGQALDRDTAAKQLGFTRKEAIDKLDLAPREFWGFGPAISNRPLLFRIDDTATTIVKSGQVKPPTPPAPEALRALLASLAATEQAAEAEPDADPKSPRVADDTAFVRLEGERDDLLGEVETLREQVAHWKAKAQYLDEHIEQAARCLGYKPLDEIADAIADRREVDAMKRVEPSTRSESPTRTPERITAIYGDIRDVEPGSPIQAFFDDTSAAEAISNEHKAVLALERPTGRALEILRVLVYSCFGVSIPEKAWAMRCGVDRKSSTWRGYKAKLRGWFIQEGDRVAETRAAMDLFSHERVRVGVPTGRALVERYIGELGKSQGSDVLQVLLDNHPRPVERHALAAAVGTEASKSTFRGYIAPLSTLELIEKHGDAYALAPELMLES